MPIQMPQWTEFLSCPICFNMFNEVANRPISLACGHTVCKACLSQLQQKKCPFDQAPINRNVGELPVNFALLQLVGVAVPEVQEAVSTDDLAGNLSFYNSGKKCIEELAILLKPVGKDSHQGAVSGSATTLSRPMQRKLVTLVNCQLVEEEGRTRAMRAARSLGERSVTELILQHQNPQQLSANLWAAVRARGCQFLGPGMQEEVLRLILLALEDGSALSRKVLVLFVVQRLEAQYPQASKTAIGHVVQLLYRASCFKVSKREEESSLMQLKEEFRGYESLRREHDAQIVQIATEAGLRISPEQWSSLLYGDTAHKSHMQSIIDKLQTPQSFSQSVHELVIALQRTGDPGNLSRLRPHLDLLSNIDPSPDAPSPSWENLEAVMKAIKTVVQGLVEFIQSCTQRRVEPPQLTNAKYRTSLCRDLAQKGSCPRGANCTFAHSQEEMDKYRIRNRKFQRPVSIASSVKVPTSASLTAKEMAELTAVSKSAEARLTVASSAQSCPQTSTLEPARPSRTMPRQSIVRGPSVKVPVARAMTLSQHHRGHAASMIYTSPTVAAKNQQPNVVPISQHMLSTRIPAENPYYQCHPIPLGRSPPYHAPPAPNLHIHTMSPPEGVAEGAEGRSADEDMSPHQRDYHIPCQDQNHQQQSCNEHLESLHSRKKELLAQLRNTRNDNAHGKHVLSESRTEPTTSRYPGDNGGRGTSMCSTTTCFSGPCVSEAAYANCLDTIPLRKSSRDPDGDLMYIHESIANSIAVTRTAIAMTRARYTGEDYSIPPSPPNLHQWSRGSLEATVEDVSDDEVDICYRLTDTEDDQFEFDDSKAVNDLADDDEFIPFEHTRVSKYGPISRNLIRANQTRNTDPLAVTASFSSALDPVTAVMFMKRPFPVVMEMPTQYAPGGGQVTTGVQSATATPDSPRAGYKVASSLPTTHIRPSLLVAGNGCEGQTVQSLKERMLNMPNMHKPAARSTAEREQIRHELVQLNKQIDHLEGSEHERLTRELQAVDMNIQETERQMDLLHTEAVEFAHLQQELEVTQAKDKQEQETRDRLMAEQIAMEEATRVSS